MSQSLYDRASILPGRSLTRSKKVFQRWAMRAVGAKVWDVDGNEYIDTTCGLGAISLGYINHGWRGPGVFSLPHHVEVEAAEAVLDKDHGVAPWASHVRFTKTGSEATHAAYRIAKAATGRDIIVRVKGSYHGWHEWCYDERNTYWIEQGALPWGVNPREVAAVFVEPARFSSVSSVWLLQLQTWCQTVGALLVFDEMIYGGRWALGGASEYFDVQPDLGCYGKAFGNGQAVAFVVGKEALAEHGEIVSGTFSGDAVGLQAVVDTLRIYTAEPVIDTLWQRAYQLHKGFSQVVPTSFCTLTGPAPLMGLQFTNPENKQPFAEAMWSRGILSYPDWFMVMFSHSPEHIDKVVEACEASAKVVA